MYFCAMLMSLVGRSHPTRAFWRENRVCCKKGCVMILSQNIAYQMSFSNKAFSNNTCGGFGPRGKSCKQLLRIDSPAPTSVLLEALVPIVGKVSNCVINFTPSAYRTIMEINFIIYHSAGSKSSHTRGPRFVPVDYPISGGVLLLI